MKKRITAFALCLALLTMMVMPAGLAEDPTPAPVVETPAPAAQTEKPTEPVKVETVEAPVVKEAPANEPANDPANDPVADPTANPTQEPAIDPTANPTQEPAIDPTANPTQEPAIDPTVEPTVEPTAEPTAEPTQEPAVEPIALQLSKSATYGVANQKSIAAQAVITGGVAPYAVRACVLLDGDIVYEDNAALSEAGTLNVSYLPHKFGKHDIRVTVIDAQGNKAEKTVTIPVAVIEEETERDWRKSVSGVKLGSDWRENIIEIAKSQLGYHESDRNFVIDDDGKVQGYTRYGHWYGSRYEDWCAMFVAFVLNYADITEYTVPRSGNCENWKNRLSGLGAYEKRDDYVPQTGDLIFFDWKDSKTNKRDGEADHIGVVERVSDTTVYTIEGNSGRAVSRQEYALDSKDILGYGNLAVLMERAGLETVEAAETEMEPAAAWTAGDRVNLRSRASVGGNIVTVLETKGTEIVLLAKIKREDGEIWYKVAYGEDIGYVRSDLVKLAQLEQPADAPEQPEQTAQGATNTDNVNVRDAASTDGAVVAKLEAAGTQLTILAEETGRDGNIWYKVEVNGATGYIRSDLVEAAAAMLAARAVMPIDEGTGEIPDTTVEYPSPKDGKVNAGSVTVYSAASETSEVVQKLYKNTEVWVKSELTDTEGRKWYFVAAKQQIRNEQVSGYVLADTIDLIEDEEDAYTKTYFNPPLNAKTNTEMPATVEATGNIGYIPADTAVTVEYKFFDSKGDKNYGIRANVGTRTLIADTLASKIDLIDPEPEEPVPETPTVENGEDGITLSVTASEGATYQWQRKVVDADGKESWENVEGATGALLKLPLEAEWLLGEYRCVTTQGEITTASSPIRPVRDEMLEWLKQEGLTEEMIKRALNAKSLESVVVENGKLIYVRDGEPFAELDPETGYIRDVKTRLIVAMLDASGSILPIIPAQ